MTRRLSLIWVLVTELLLVLDRQVWVLMCLLIIHDILAPFTPYFSLVLLKIKLMIIS